MKTLIMLTMLTIAFTLSGSACVQEKHHFFISADYSYYQTKDYWNSKGDQRSAHDDFTKHMVETYIEYGLTNCDTISLQFGWAKVVETLNGNTFGFNDLKLGWRRQIGQFYSHFVAIEVDAYVPLEHTYKPGIRYGEYGAELNLLATRSFNFLNGWYDARVGYLWYSGFPSDQILADLALNFQLCPRLFLSVSADLEYGVFNGQSRPDASRFLYNPNYRLLIGRVEATVCLGRGFSIYGRCDQHVWGRNVGTGAQFYGGLQYQY